jgi:Fe-S-cluster-containing hydrogenase component 2
MRIFEWATGRMKICPMQAIRMEDSDIFVNSDLCIGCGNCATVCPPGSLTMVRHSEYHPPNVNPDLVGLGV